MRQWLESFRHGKPFWKRREEDPIDRLVEAARRIPWSITLLQMAWTAGPVTYLALQGGYLIGFGKAAPRETLIYFVSYTLIAALIGVAAKIIYDGFIGERYRRSKNDLTLAVDRLPDLVLAMRDLRLQFVPEEQQAFQAAALLLREVSVHPYSVYLIVQEMTGDVELAEMAARLELFRRSALCSRMQNLIETHAERIAEAVNAVAEKSPEAAELLNERLHGRAPNQSRGMPREENFIERIFAAVEQGNEALMTLADAEAVLVLAFELLSGRKIPMLTFGYRGRWEWVRATDAVETRYHRYRVAHAASYNRLKALVAYLAEQLDERYWQGPTSAPAADLLQQVYDGLEAMLDELEACEDGRGRSASECRHLHHVLYEGMRLFRAMQRAYKQVGRRHATYLQARASWEALLGKEVKRGLQVSKKGRGGLYLYERCIELDDEEKLEFAKRLAGYIRKHNICVQDDRLMVGDASGLRQMDVSLARQLGIEVALALNDYVELGRPAVQRAIYASSAIFFGDFEYQISPAVKATWGAALVEDLDEERGRAAEYLALRLVQSYGLRLEQDAMDFLVREYGANPERLSMLLPRAEGVDRHPLSLLSTKPAVVLAGDERGNRIADRAEALLRRLG